MSEKPRRDEAEELEPVADDAAEGPADEAEVAASAADEDAMDLEQEVARLEQDLADHRDRLLRTVAEMDNLRKRTRREIAESRRFAQAELLRPLLDILDNFDRALRHAPDEGDGEGDAASEQSFRQGVEMIAQSFRQTLLEQGVRPIEAEGREFDPALHEAVGQAPATDEASSGTVLSVVQEGYTLDGMVLRASRVIVAQ